MRQSTKRIASTVLASAMVFTTAVPLAVYAQSPVTLAAGGHIATYVGQVPAVDGVTWAEGVTADTFADPYSTVTVQDTQGNEYTVEVVPEDLVYFIDSYSSQEDTAATEPYSAVKALVGDSLVNQAADQKKTDSNTWGYTDAPNNKALDSVDVTDKGQTFLYGDNKAGDTLSYQLYLEPGEYTIVSGHWDPWFASSPNNTRGMDFTVTHDGKTEQAGSMQNVGSTEVENEFTFTVETAQTVTYTMTALNGQAPMVSWVGVSGEEKAETPFLFKDPATTEIPDVDLPGNVVGPLEDNDGLTYATGTILNQVTGCGNMMEVNVQWNNSNNYHATINNAQDLFGRTSFTLLADIKMYEPSGDPNRVDQRVSFTLGTSANSLHATTWSGKFGWGGNEGGVSTNLVDLQGLDKTGWNALALVYNEAEGGNGSVTVYLNGQKAAEVADVGFKMSELEGIVGYIARSFDTNYLQEGLYDNIVVTDAAIDEATAIAETAARKAAKESLPANTAELETALAQAKALLVAGVPDIDTAALEQAVAEAEALLAENPGVERQDEIDAMAQKLNSELSRVQPVDVAINGSDVDAAAENINGLTYKGWGMLNGNSTSNLLLDYKSENPEQYWEMMEYLFGGEYPLFTHIKMEMGNDGNNSTGAEACTMRSEDEEADASRSPGFAMAADAKKINPDVKVSILRWGMPSWVQDKWNNNVDNQGYEAMYTWYRETIFDAYEKYGYVVDFVNPDTNETGNPDEAFIKWFEDRVAGETEFPDYMDQEARDAYNNIRIIASDENKGLQIVPSMRADEELYDAVDIIGFHYRTNATDDYVAMADVDDKEVWYSEGCATFGYSELQENKTTEYGYESIGGYQSPLALVDGYINSFTASRRTHYIFQPAIGSFYEGIQYGHKELISARDPWSGYIHYDPALYMTAHFTAFAKAGWEDNDPTQNEIWRAIPAASYGSFGGSDNEHMTAGINGNASYLTLAAPDKTDFSVVVVNNTQNAKTFRITADGLNVADDAQLRVWATETDSYMQDKGTVQGADGVWYVSVPAYSVVTATTLVDVEPQRVPEEGIHNEDRDVLDTDGTGRENGVTDDEYLYADNFEYTEEPDVDVYNAVTGESTKTDYLTSRGNEPRYMLDSHGAWVVENGQLSQILTRGVSQWNGGDPMTMVGDFRWMNYSASVDVTKVTGYATLVIRSQGGMGTNDDGYALTVTPDGTWTLKRYSTVVAQGNVPASDSYSLKMEGRGAAILAYIDGELVAQYVDEAPMLAGRVKLASGWTETCFDNLEVKTLNGYIPYATSMIDGQDDGVTYEGSWSIDNPGSGSADNWYRTISKNTAADAAFSFTVQGTGFALVGPNSAGAELEVYVDGELYETAATVATGRRYETYTATGLANTTHEVKVVVKSGTLQLDAIYAYADILGDTTDKTTLQEVYDQYKDLEQGSYTEDSWSAFAAARDEAAAVLADETATQEQIDLARVALAAAAANLIAPNDEEPSEEPIFTANASTGYQGLTLYGNATTESGVLALDGTTGTWASIDREAVNFDGRDTFTVSFDVLAKQSSGNFFTFAVGKNDQQYLFERIRGNSAYVAMTDSGWNGEEKISVTSDNYVDRWATMTLVVTPDSMSLYENGALIGTVDKTVQVLDFGTNVQAWLGRSFYSADSYFQGSFDNIEIFNRALDANEVSERYAPADDDIAAVVSEIEHTATWQNTLPVLPETITVRTYGGEEKEVSVTWSMDKADFATAYDVVTVSGAIDGTRLTVKTSVEVVPEGLEWFIDSGAASSPVYDAVAKLTGLKNIVSDQALSAGDWGYNADDVVVKGDTDPNNKLSTGLYAKGSGASSLPVSYTLPLTAGTYDITTGYHEWWSMTRIMKVVATWTDSEGQAQSVTINEPFTISSGNLDSIQTGRLVLDEDATVTISAVLGGGDQAPVMNLLAIARVNDEPEPTAEPTATPEPTAEPTATPVPTAEPTATPAPTEKPTASVIENETVTEGAQLPIVVKVEAAFDSFLRVLLNGNELDAANYELKEGSIIITLKPAFVETLEVGRYTLCVQTENGDAEVTFEVKAKTPNPDATVTPAPTTAPTQPDTGDSSTLPATGDTSAAALLAVLMTASAAMAVAIKRRKQN